MQSIWFFLPPIAHLRCHSSKNSCFKVKGIIALARQSYQPVPVHLTDMLEMLSNLAGSVLGFFQNRWIIIILGSPATNIFNFLTLVGVATWYLLVLGSEDCLMENSFC